MTVTVTIEQDDLYKAMELAENEVRYEWFHDDEEAYEEWAGDRVTSALFSFIDILGKYGISIEY